MSMQMTDYASNVIMQLFFQAQNANAPSEQFLCLLTTNATHADTGLSISNGTGTGVEINPSGNNYARMGLNTGTVNWTLTGHNTITNANALVWPSITWSATVVGLFIADAQLPTGGNGYFFGPLQASKVCSAGDYFVLNPGQVSIDINT